MLTKNKFILVLIFFLFSHFVSAQCAMCKAVVESGETEMAEGLNNGIIYLMAFPYILVGVAGYFLFKKWKKK
ncbi:hypothetical protein EGM88_11015 [Aureibaculum marinum]|uniref:Adenylosuccinate synthetase n=1 Tax=Aureibaculum marinum TaxID=2487930 RepID=A0A3N4NIF4_9FLAO|nr:hypothetical protein [Aureibaculum marinum]RPD95991.1 hypothetical protein EGM88_11015 [Aureibaculum marinum]